jgi:hypothetical protein
VVYINGFFDTSSGATGTLTNQVTITGLPFTSQSGTYGFGITLAYFVGINFPAGAVQATARVGANSTTIFIEFATDNGSPIDMIASDIDGSDDRLVFSGSYIV